MIIFRSCRWWKEGMREAAHRCVWPVMRMICGSMRGMSLVCGRGRVLWSKEVDDLADHVLVAVDLPVAQSPGNEKAQIGMLVFFYGQRVRERGDPVIFILYPERIGPDLAHGPADGKMGGRKAALFQDQAVE